jgi:hypothetical protein
MGLEEIAAGITVTDEQEARGVPEVDVAGEGLADRLASHADALPCTPEAAATLLDRHAAGDAVDDAAHEAGVAPVTAAKALHRCGVAGVNPLAPTARAVVRDWLCGELPRSEAETLARADAPEFALAAYIETHDPVPELAAVAEAHLSPSGDASVAKRDALGETMSSVTDLF